MDCPASPSRKRVNMMFENKVALATAADEGALPKHVQAIAADGGTDNA